MIYFPLDLDLFGNYNTPIWHAHTIYAHTMHAHIHVIVCRWVCTSGLASDLIETDRIALEVLEGIMKRGSKLVLLMFVI